VKTFGKYRLIEPLASGGMAEVWRAEAAGPGGFAREVALKLVRGDRRADAEFVRLFGREALLASRLVHPNIVQVFDHDEVEGRHYLAMELVRGRTLREVVDRCREAGLRLGLARAVHVGVEVARALAYAHGLRVADAPQGVVHRDVSPQNVLVGFEGEVKLADFGIARALDAGGLTSPGAVRGKAAYMAPEQARGEPVDGRADVFALAVVLWELCTGSRLFARDSEPATLQALLSGPPPSPPSAWNERVPPELDQALLAALERDPERRTRSAAELEEALAAVRFRLARAPEETDLRTLMRQLWPGAAEPRPPAEPTRLRPGPAASAVGAEEASTRTAPRSGRGRARPVAALLAVMGLVGGVAWWRSGATPTSTSTPTPTSTATPTAPPTSTSTPTPTSTSTPTATPTAPPTAALDQAAPDQAAPDPSPTPVEASAALRITASTRRIGSLPLPPAESGEGLLSVNAAPWARITVDGAAVGDTPRELRLPAGRYRVKASHPARGAAEETLEVRPGQRRSWQPRLHP
jgi:serine/threonine-protein kinase